MAARKISSMSHDKDKRKLFRKSSTTFTLTGGWTKDPFCSVEEGLSHCYKKTLRPFEESSSFQEFHAAATLEDADFSAKPLVMIIGQYSTGKSTLIRYLIEADYPGIRIGPEPTTDRFNVIMHNDKPGIIPGNALVVDSKFQFKPLEKFGNAFLNRFQCSQSDSVHLENMTLIDTPGVLSGDKQSLDRGYDYVEVLQWFAARVDRIIVLFDANKLDISDELRKAMQALRSYDEKLRIVLNKADSVDQQQLMRVYGALMWSLGRVFNTPEVVRVYIGSFWEGQLVHETFRSLFKEEQGDLFQDLKGLPRQAALRKLNDFIKRARLVKIHAIILSEISKKMPAIIGKKKKKREILNNLEGLFKEIQNKFHVSAGDFPEQGPFVDRLKAADWDKFRQVDPAQLRRLDRLLSDDVARMMDSVPAIHNDVEFMRHLLDDDTGAATPFNNSQEKSLDDEYEWELRHLGGGWVVAKHDGYKGWVKDFDALQDGEGKVVGGVAREELLKSRLPETTLRKIWRLSDLDRDGSLSEDEFCLAMYLINRKVAGKNIPKELPDFLLP